MGALPSAFPPALLLAATLSMVAAPSSASAEAPPGGPPPAPGILPALSQRTPVVMPEGLEADTEPPRCLVPGAAWLTVSECTVVGQAARPAQDIPASAVLRSAREPGILWANANGRWFRIQVSQVRVRAAAISTIDGRAGSSFGFPPSPVVPGGARLLAQPQAQGITLTAGITRVFCGVRSQGEVESADFAALCRLFAIPGADELIALLK